MTANAPSQKPRLRDVRAAERRDLATSRDRAGRNKPWRRRFRIARRAVGSILIRTALPPFLRLLSATWRVQRQGQEHLLDAMTDTGLLVAMWHGRMLPLLPSHKNLGIHVLVSPSGDGELVMHVLRRFGYHVIRGSSSRQGSRALREMRDQLQQRQTVVITPDGPRGPRHTTNIGLAWLARETGLPILCAGVAVDRAWRLRSWDRFLIPKPFARIRISYSKPVAVPEDASENDLEQITAQFHRTLLRSEADAFAVLGVPRDFDDEVPDR